LTHELRQDLLAGGHRGCFLLLNDWEALIPYSIALGLDGASEGALALARAVAASRRWDSMPRATLVVRLAPQPMLGAIGYFDALGEARLQALAEGLSRSCASLRYVSYAQAEQDCEQLAAQLVDRFGRQELGRFRFAAIPRGGHIVLGMLAYVLGLEPTQLQPSPPPDIPLVAVDDCALTGARFRGFLQGCPSRQVVFAHLYSHPDLRAAIKAQEPRVLDCLSTWDLRDHAPERLGDEAPSWRDRWLARLDGPLYWIGQLEPICFAWNEPDRFFWNPVTEGVDGGWPIVPPELCLKTRSTCGMARVTVQVQPEGRGPLKPARRVLFGEFEGQTVVCDPDTGESFSLSGVAADMWRGIVEHGTLHEVTSALVQEYHVEEATLRTELRAFVDDLLARGLLQNDLISNLGH